MAAESDPIPLEGEAELSPAERLALRRIIREHEHMTWARRRLWRVLSIVGAVAGAMWAAGEWVAKHIKVVP